MTNCTDDVRRRQVHWKALATVFLRNEEGSLAIVHLATVLFFAVLLAFMLNLTSVVDDKFGTQAAADAAARSAAVVTARGMNALCAANHLIGETLGMLAVHEALTGRPAGVERFATTSSLESRRRQAERDARKSLRDVHEKLKRAIAVNPEGQVATPFAYSAVSPAAGCLGAVLLAETELKDQLAVVYTTKANLILAEQYSAAAALNVRESAIRDENARLVELRNRGVARNRDNADLRRHALVNLLIYADEVVKEFPVTANAAAKEIGKLNGVEIELVLPMSTLPVSSDPLAKASDPSAIPATWYGPDLRHDKYPIPHDAKKANDMRRQIVKVTQLCRATWPWVNYHRQPVLDYLSTPGLFEISGAEKKYFDETVGATIQACDDLQLAGAALYVMHNSPTIDKGYEVWTDDPAAADSVASVIAIARRSRSQSSAITGAFDAVHPESHVSMAQALIYNANPQVRHANRIDLKRKRIAPWHQPNIGWDTLQWAQRPDWVPHPEKADRANYDNGMPYELVGSGSIIRPDFPVVRLAWEAKLVPISRSQLAVLRTRRPDLAGELRLSAEEFQVLVTH